MPCSCRHVSNTTILLLECVVFALAKVLLDSATDASLGGELLADAAL